LKIHQKNLLGLWGGGTVHTHLLVACNHSTPCFFSKFTLSCKDKLQMVKV